MKSNFACLIVALAFSFGCSTTQHPVTPAAPAFAPAPPSPRALTIRPMLASPQVASAAQAQVQVSVGRRITPPPSTTLGWDQSSDPSISGYIIYYGVASGTYSNSVNAGSATSLSVSNLAFGTTYFFAATDYNSTGESVYSNEVSWTTPSLPLPPGNFRMVAGFASNLEGPWLADTNWPPIIVSDPLGNQFWNLQIIRLP